MVIKKENTIYDIEKKVNTIYKNRKAIFDLTKEINDLKVEVVEFMKVKGKHQLSINDLSVAIKFRDKKFADFKILQEYIDKGVIPKETMKNSKIEMLQVSSVADFELIGNKFIKK